MSVLKRWAAGSPLRSVTPRWLVSAIRNRMLLLDHKKAGWEAQNPYVSTRDEWEFAGDGSEPIGVAFDFAHQHSHYLSACHEMNIPYRVIDLTASDWQDRLASSGVRTLFVWPSVYSTLWKTMTDDRLRAVQEYFGVQVYPDVSSVWLYESKRRIRDWLRHFNYPHPHTDVFFQEEHAVRFVQQATFPLVAKTDLGAAASGVRFINSREEALTYVRQAFRWGILLGNGDIRDRHWGYVIFQEYLPGIREWRLVRVGDSYFCREKQIGADGMHSGSGTVRWANPDPVLLENIRGITTRHGYTSLNIDYFETQDHRYLINEVHVVFGAIRQKNISLDAENMGRHLWNPETGSWGFEHGFFYHNACANLRIQHVLAGQGRQVPLQCNTAEAR